MPYIGQRLSVCMALSVWWLSLYGFMMVLLGLALLDLLLALSLMLCSGKVIPYLRRAQARSYRLRIIDSSLKGYIDFGLGKK